MATASPEPVGVGKIVAGRYAILQPLGRGGGGRVWLAEDLLRDRRLVAFKSVKPGGGNDRDAALAASLKQEFRVLTQLRHPNLMRVFDIGGLGGGVRYLTEEYVDGETLEDLVGRFPTEHLESLCAELLQALDYLDRKGVLHRDIKPSNVMIQWRVDGSKGATVPHVKLVDFGLAMSRGQGDAGLKGGTRRFMAPEVRLGMDSDGVSELFSLAATIYCVVVGEPPLAETTNPASLLGAPGVSFDAVPDDVPAGVRGVLKRMLSMSRPGRYANAREALDDLIFRSEGRLAETSATNTPPLDEGELVGRRDILEGLVSSYTEGEPKRWLIVGPPGFGKRRIAREFEVQAQLMERTTFRVEVSPGNPPYLIPVELTEQLQRLKGEHRQQRGEKLFGNPARRRGSPLSTFNTAFEPMLLRHLSELAAVDEMPVVIIEDIDLADGYSLRILSKWCQTSARFCLLATAQSVPDQLAEVVEVVTLRPMNREEVLSFLCDSFGQVEASDEALDTLVERSGGSPSNLRAICAELMRIGLLKKRDVESWILLPLPSNFAADVEGAFEQSLEALSPAGVRVLEFLSLVERPVPEGFLIETLMSMREDWELQEELSHEGYLSRLLRELELRACLHIDRKNRQTMIRPPGDRLIKLVRARLTEPRQISLHKAIGTQLAAAWVQEEGAGAREVAYHLQRGQQPAEACLFEMIAAMEAIKVGALQRAQEHLSYAMKARLHGPERAYVRLFEGILATRQSDSDAARSAFIEAGQFGQDSYAGALAHIYQTRAALERGQFEAAQVAMRTLARRWPQLSSTYLMERLRGSFAGATLQFDAAVMAYERARRVAVAYGWREGKWVAQLEMAACLLEMGDLDRAEPEYRDLLRVLPQKRASSKMLGEVWTQWGWLRYLRGDMVEGRASVSRGLELFQEAGHLRGRVSALAMMATLEIEMGLPDDARWHVNQAIELRSKSRHRGEQLLLSGLHHLARVAQGDQPETAVATLDALHRRAQRAQDPLKSARSALLLARGRMFLRDDQGARAVLQHAVEKIDTTPTRHHMLTLCAQRLLHQLNQAEYP